MPSANWEYSGRCSTSRRLTATRRSACIHHQNLEPKLPAPEERQTGLLRRFTRQFFVQHRGVIHEGGHNDRGLLQFVRLNAIENVFIRMVRAAAVIERVLNELEAGQTDVVERNVIGAAGV